MVLLAGCGTTTGTKAQGREQLLAAVIVDLRPECADRVRWTRTASVARAAGLRRGRGWHLRPSNDQPGQRRRLPADRHRIGGVVSARRTTATSASGLPYAEERATRYRVALIDWKEPRSQLPALAVAALRNAGAPEGRAGRGLVWRSPRDVRGATEYAHR